MRRVYLYFFVLLLFVQSCKNQATEYDYPSEIRILQPRPLTPSEDTLMRTAKRIVELELIPNESVGVPTIFVASETSLNGASILVQVFDAPYEEDVVQFDKPLWILSLTAMSDSNGVGGLISFWSLNGVACSWQAYRLNTRLAFVDQENSYEVVDVNISKCYTYYLTPGSSEYGQVLD